MGFDIMIVVKMLSDRKSMLFQAIKAKVFGEPVSV